MNILILCTYFPPDSAIAAVRPYMFAKYLAKFGHSVTVIRSGEIDHNADETYDEEKEAFRIYSFLGENSDAERFKRGDVVGAKTVVYKYAYIPPKLRNVLSKSKKTLLDPYKSIKDIKKAKEYFLLQKEIIDKLGESDEKYDVVFSTYANLENIYAGEYAAKKFNAKWVMDFRDPIVWYAEPQKWVWNIYASKMQKKVLKKADLYTCVSEGLRETFLKIDPESRIVTLYNGYEAEGKSTVHSVDNNRILSFCYTGQFYELRRTALEAFVSKLADLVHLKNVDINRIRFTYAGNGSSIVEHVLTQYGLEQIFDDRGFVSRSAAKEIQDAADVFLVLSWNTLKSQGVLTGKFYEGIRAEKPIVSIIAGDLPNSELYNLNNRFDYGYCYECSGTDDEEFLCYLEKLYLQKTKTGKIDYEPKASLKQSFQYNYIVKNFESLCAELVNDCDHLKIDNGIPMEE